MTYVGRNGLCVVHVGVEKCEVDSSWPFFDIAPFDHMVELTIASCFAKHEAENP